MQKLEWVVFQEALKYFEYCWRIAKNATCERSKCGSIIVKNWQIIWEGINTPPNNLENQRRCWCEKSSYHKKVTDKTCCVHAEQRAIMDALKKHPEFLEKSKLYFIRLDETENISFAGKPYCTICSKMALDVGIEKFVLWHKDKMIEYDTDEYNTISFQYENKNS